ncbi:hypothetical protein ACLKMH_24035 [Psychromonas sp. KJ10-10]|uniref:hypothetical protein n=1 Tax=Psychromonas sp. KJ10-10 TaxID=3391823 RepID=UPI0039B6B870
MLADGYLTGATVCLDLNNNKVCDDGEPVATTTDGGAFTIDATQTQIDSIPLLVEVTETTIDEDYPEKALTPYTLSAPAGYTFVSPLTSMVQNEIEKNGSTLAIAEKAIQELIGTTLSLDSDYIAGASDDSSSDENKVAFAKLHKVAQVVASIVAEQMSDSENDSYSTNALSSAIMVAVIANLESITQQVDARY